MPERHGLRLCDRHAQAILYRSMRFKRKSAYVLVGVMLSTPRPTLPAPRPFSDPAPRPTLLAPSSMLTQKSGP